jgi:DNA-binding NtrC family response regulator
MKTILLVDDEPHLVEIMEETLITFGYHVIPRPDAQSALDLIREGTDIDLVITDYRLPGMNGIEFLERCRKILPSVPIIMITGYGSVETYLRSLNLGAFEYLLKPYDVTELHRVVKSALQWSSEKSALPVS